MASSLTRPRGRPRDLDLRQRRENAILEMAARLFAERGYRNTDLQVVADALQVGKGTIYRYFSSKQELFLAAVDRGLAQLAEQVDAVVATIADPLEQIIEAIHAYLAFFDAHPDFVELFIQERAEFKDRKQPLYFERREAAIGRWYQLIRDLVACGRVRELPVEAVADAVNDLLYGTIFANYFTGRRRSFRAQATEIVNLVLFGILSDRERKRRAANAS